ncbi:MAG: hypothetical protein MJ212_04390 [Alphaproteobacteria bacterium]|nr:hypothetical protein [Alphaproteobacteria bacterium]
MATILEMMLENCKKSGYYPTQNIEKIAKAKNMMFGENEWRRCPCDGSNEARYCISELCQSDIERDGICHCRCYQKASSGNK